MDLLISDFTEKNYIRLLRMAKERFRFYRFSDNLIEFPHVLWRHDCDFSIHRALRLAHIEHEEEVRATYFILLHNEFYNILEKNILEKVKEIISLGHSVGLHFDQSFWDITNSYELENKIKFEKEILENLVGHKLDAISFHNPIFDAGLDIKKNSYAGLINTYSPGLFDNYKYVSDSNGYWRYDRLEETLKNIAYEKLHILTHPEWWTPESMFPRQRVVRCVNGRAASTLGNYDNFLKEVGRLNV